MKSQLKKYLLLVIALVLPLSSYAQGKVYTRKVRISDYPVCTTMAVLDSGYALTPSLREEVVSRWRISSYEFCTPQEYEKLKTRSDLYFLKAEKRDGIVFLCYSRGGDQKNDDPRKEYLEIVALPAVASESAKTGLMGAYIDVIQRFVEDAAASDKIAYAGLRHYNMPGMSRRSPETYDRVTVGPYVMAIDRKSHRLLMFQKRKTNGKSVE